ncbi:UvrD-helicase domain-containing protein [Mesorhizobium sp.]|uniref:UvrD-helicase domain-containing protein n=1 Tax=Mesorhizobium sp. TaxID=1871066 RepID=UPI0025E67FEF|nr:UvrD-helicase domain-containing protein [Mesorhizobium sp.]
MIDAVQIGDNHYDQEADQVIRACLDLDKPTSFFLYAGAGSGKTRSLVNAIDHVRRTAGRRLSLSCQKVGVITYTNAARDEIKHRLEYDPRVEVSTIHAFAWSLISGHNDDIREWVKVTLKARIEELTAQIAGTSNKTTKTYQDRVRSLESRQRRLGLLDGVKKFVYSPTGDNRTRDALNHSEVIAITSEFLTMKPTLQRLLVSLHPILLVDESQDTNRHLLEALLAVQTAYSNSFCLGLLGDTMQRIYTDGKVDLGQGLVGWALPKKVMNHRCPHRIIKLINRVRDEVDGQAQMGRKDKPEGHIRLFALPQAGIDKATAEEAIARKMADISGDDAWVGPGRQFKTLTLEHHMAAIRFGFAAMFEPLYRQDRLQTSLLEGSSAPLRFFSKEVLPAVKALKADDQFALAALVRDISPLLAPKHLRAKNDGQMAQLRDAKNATDALLAVFSDGHEPTFREVLEVVGKSGLFAIPEVLLPFTTPDEPARFDSAETATAFEAYDKSETSAWREMLDTKFEQIDAYDRYVSGSSPFGTHQGVKGLEFPRVMVVISDEEARGFLFSYDKLFGVKAKSDTDRTNEASGKETSIDRTRRLFYVTCSRAEKSLAIVCYTANPEALAQTVVARDWFAANEVEIMRP